MVQGEVMLLANTVLLSVDDLGRRTFPPRIAGLEAADF
jgi:hypothetical protein